LLALLILIPSALSAQNKEARRDIREGNVLYRKAVDLGPDSTVVKRQQGLFSDALTLYKKAVEKDATDARGYYNLGNACMMTGQLDSAIVNFETASKLESNKLRAAKSFHNMGVIRQQQQQFAQAIEYYKDALRRNPEDDETRYNLALCLHQLK
jgi:Ca-activated chloride channel family protein